MPLEEFGTPLDWVTFTVQGQQFTVRHVTARDISDLDRVIVRDEDGGFYVFRNWETFSQSPGNSFFPT